MTSLKSWFRRLSVRLALMSAAVIVSALIIFTYLVAENEAKTLSLELRQQAIALADNLAASSASFIVVKDYTTLESILLRAAKFPSIIELQVISAEGIILSDVFQNAQGVIEPRFGNSIETLPSKPEQRITNENNALTVWQPVILGDLVGWLRINYTLARIEEVRAQAWRYNILVGVIVAIITIGILFLYLRKPVLLIEESAAFADELDQHAGQQMTVNNSYLELHKLTTALNRTSLSLQEKNEALNKKILGQEQLNVKLEQMVQDRTEELSVARDEAVRANKSKSQFLANMSHEIRTPLTAIIGFSDSILDSDQTTIERIESAKRVTRAGKHLLRVINEILDLSKIEADKLEVEIIPVNLIEVFRDVYSIVKLPAEEKDLSVVFDCEYPIPDEIHIDPVRFKQILINLCNNAIKFTKEGSVSIKISCDKKSESLFVKVIDTGIGLSDEQQKKLFKPFSQTETSIARDYGGTGLGLYLSKQLAEKLGGSITVESILDVGSSFNLTVRTGTLDNASWIYERPDFDKFDDELESMTQLPEFMGRVLLAEDNPDNQRLISLYLKRLGVEFELASNGKECIKKVKNFSPDLIVMDIQMPVMDGLTATQKLRNQGFQQPIIALTANAMRHEQKQCLDAGCNDVCTKPIDQNDFVRVLSKYLKSTSRHENQSPIFSSLLQNDPEMREIVVTFVNRLPEMTSEIIAAFADDDIDKMKLVVHNLKGTSGNCGYNDIFDITKRIEFDLIAGNLPAVVKSLEMLALIQKRVIIGINEISSGGTTSNVRPFNKPK